MRSRARPLTALFWLCVALGASGCASSEAAAPPRPLVLAVLPAPALSGAASESEALSPGDFLLEVATQLSLEARLDLCLAPGPLLAPGVAESSFADALQSLQDGLGQIAPPVYVGLGAEEAGAVELLEALQRTLRQHPGRASAWGPPVLGWRPVALAAGADLSSVEAEAKRESAPPSAGEGEQPEPKPQGEEEAERERSAPLLVALGGGELVSDPRLRLQVISGPEPGLAPAPSGGLVLTLPPAARGLFALCTLDSAKITVEWRSVAPEAAPPAPQSLPWAR